MSVKHWFDKAIAHIDFDQNLHVKLLLQAK